MLTANFSAVGIWVRARSDTPIAHGLTQWAHQLQCNKR